MNRKKAFSRRLAAISAWGLALTLVTGCSGTTPIEQLRQEMYDQARYEPLEKSTFFADGRASRPWIPGTVARGHLRTDAHLYTGLVHGEPAEIFPFEITREVLARGQDRYEIFCTPCHGALGDGRGMVVRRGMKQPPSFHIDRLQQSPPGYYFDVMTQGFGMMYSYASSVTPRDRWAIAAYIRALQLSQDARPEDVPSDIRLRLENE